MWLERAKILKSLIEVKNYLLVNKVTIFERDAFVKTGYYLTDWDEILKLPFSKKRFTVFYNCMEDNLKEFHLEEIKNIFLKNSVKVTTSGTYDYLAIRRAEYS